MGPPTSFAQKAKGWATASSRAGIQRFQARNPAGNVGAEFLVLFPEFSAQRRLFIKKNKGKKSQPDNESVLQQGDAAEEQSLAED